MVFAGAPFAVIPLFKLYDCFIAGSGYVVRGIAGVVGTIYVICCRHLYAIMHEWRVRSLFYENITMSLLFIVLLLPLIHLSSEQVFIHTIPVNRGAAFLVIKEEPLKTAKAFFIYDYRR